MGEGKSIKINEEVIIEDVGLGRYIVKRFEPGKEDCESVFLYEEEIEEIAKIVEDK